MPGTYSISGTMRRSGELRDRAGLNSVSLATSYHAGRFLQPRSPKRKVYFPEDGTIYFHPTPAPLGGARRSNPRSPDVIAGRRGRSSRARDAGGTRAASKCACWTVCLHNTRLGMLHPGAVTRNAFGDPNYYSLCPSNPDARAYVCALVEDLTTRTSQISSNSRARPSWDSLMSYHHDKDGVGLTAEDDFALSLCFCDSCLARAAKAGVDGEAARRTVAQWIVEACERETPKPRFP